MKDALEIIRRDIKFIEGRTRQGAVVPADALEAVLDELERLRAYSTTASLAVTDAINNTSTDCLSCVEVIQILSAAVPPPDIAPR